jgi:hypothetical protein
MEKLFTLIKLILVFNPKFINLNKYEAKYLINFEKWFLCFKIEIYSCKNIKIKCL